MALHTEMYLSFVRSRATEVVDRELIDSRGNIWGLEEDRDSLPTWVALTPAAPARALVGSLIDIDIQISFLYRCLRE